MGDFTTVASFQDLAMAGLAKSRLEADGLECRLANEHLVGVNWLYSNALGGVEVQVRAEDAGRAWEILNEDSAPVSFGPEDASAHDMRDEVCERCGSTNIGIAQTSTWAGVASVLIGVLLLGLPFILHRKRFRCADCGYVMKKST